MEEASMLSAWRPGGVASKLVKRHPLCFAKQNTGNKRFGLRILSGLKTDLRSIRLLSN